jgi:hypothetical protein
MILNNNSLLEWHKDGVEWFERILHVESEGRKAICLNLGSDPHGRITSWPFERTKEQLDESEKLNQVKVRVPDPFLRPMVDIDKLKAEPKARWEKHWKAIESIVTDPQRTILRGCKAVRDLLDNAAKEAGLSSRQIERLIRKYWQGGQTNQCILGDFRNCGGRKRMFLGGKKRGKWSALENDQEKRIGLVITDGIKDILLSGRDEFYHHHSQMTLRDSYDLTMGSYFCAGSELRNGIYVPLLKSPDELVTFEQYRRLHYANRDPEKEIRSRLSDKHFRLQGRALRYKTESQLIGPGAVGQMDSTTADIYLVSEDNPDLILGRPVIYAIKDAWCRFLYAIIVTFERPSYWSAMLALENALSNKAEYCAQYGLPISPDEWPVDFLPAQLRVDGGEMSMYQSDHLVRGLPIEINVVPPGRGDLKGIIEQHFRLNNNKLIRWLPGSWPRISQYRKHRPAFEAVLTISEFRRLLLQATLLYHKEIMKNYTPTPDMVKAGISLTPISLLNWGLENRGAHFFRYPLQMARYHLLPHAEAVVKETGVEFNKLIYTSERVVKEKWQEKARAHGSRKMKIAFDPRYTHTIYYQVPETGELENLVLSSAHSAYGKWTWTEIKEYRIQARLNQLEHSHEELQERITLKAIAATVIKDAKQRKRRWLKDNAEPSKVKQLASIPENRSVAIIEERQLSLRDDEPRELSENLSTPCASEKQIPNVPIPASQQDAKAPVKESALMKKLREHGRRGAVVP